MIPWTDIDFALLDMDGTLLDRYFDDFFWEEHVPEHYAKEERISYEEARDRLLAAYKSQEKSLNWTDVDYWSNRLGLDIVKMKEEIRDQVRIHPGVEPFLQFLRDEGKEVILVTNAHPKTVRIKLEQTLLLPYFHTVLCSSDIGLPKEEIGFWRDAARMLRFNKARSVLIDDNEDVLLAAHTFGIKHIIHKNHASSRMAQEASDIFPSVEHLNQLIP
ncbi:MAG: GMP/IMP nucleotidase [Nitrospiria bacterium]